ncbi:TPA: hypothetical protein L6B11_21775 [Pseudomonas aeruginosa]|nr:hypothetical protein [Pseudomonas aeruginosa]
MHRCGFPPKRESVEADTCFRAKARKRKPSNPYRHGNAEAALCRSGKARRRLSGSGGIRRSGFP